MTTAIHDRYLAASERRHRELDEAIHEEARRPLPDTLLLQTLKRQKLRLKQQCHERRRELNGSARRPVTA